MNEKFKTLNKEVISNALMDNFDFSLNMINLIVETIWATKDYSEAILHNIPNKKISKNQF